MTAAAVAVRPWPPAAVTLRSASSAISSSAAPSMFSNIASCMPYALPDCRDLNLAPRVRVATGDE